MMRLFMDVGSKDGLRPSDVVGAIANEAQIPGKAIGVIEIKDTYSFVEIPEHLVQRVVAALGRTRLRGRDVRVEVAQPGERDERRGGDGRTREESRPRQRQRTPR